MMPQWLHVISVASLAAGFAIAILIALDEVRHPQHMWIMNLVWPICALFGTVFVLGAYLAYGQAHPHRRSHVPFAVTVGIGAAHCGSGCTLGDLIAEWLAYFYPAAAIIFGWQLLFAERMFAVWILDFILAFGFGIVFQYYAMCQMRNLSPRQGIIAALKADTLSLTAWQIGMYGFMAFAQFYLFRQMLHTSLDTASAEFWLMMQIAMICEFITSYPVNWCSSGSESKRRRSPRFKTDRAARSPAAAAGNARSWSSRSSG